tara:strand:- start:422 stop:640 length:219 start_codon:yes stop_codon:yes gene_type:complete
MATKNLKSVYLNLRIGEGSVSGNAIGKFTVEDVASGSASVELSGDTSLTDAKAAVIAKLQEDGSTVVDQTGE